MSNNLKKISILITCFLSISLTAYAETHNIDKTVDTQSKGQVKVTGTTSVSSKGKDCNAFGVCTEETYTATSNKNISDSNGNEVETSRTTTYDEGTVNSTVTVTEADGTKKTNTVSKSK